uniref:Uncharacterized protein n=1 Tax=Brassica oleracea TaxID=3712 RepID=A0A3P6CYW9_BRAOL|nr:unnamed protein product [Brassica oleracea]
MINPGRSKAAVYDFWRRTLIVFLTKKKMKTKNVWA